MTEHEWLTCRNPLDLLSFLDVASDRKLRLFTTHACRGCPILGAYEGLEAAVDCAEQLTDGMASAEDLRAANEAIEWGRYEMCDSLNRLSEAVGVANSPKHLGRSDAEDAVRFLAAIYPLITLSGREEDGYPHHCQLLRELLPYRPVAADPRWLTSTVAALAAGIYDERAFDRMPILADALQDAGCEDEDVLGHCRGPGLHVRGCWVVDLVLGKS